MGAAHADILMYHSISDAAGPTSIPASVFGMQMDALAASGRPVIALDALPAWRRGALQLDADPVIITFDDGFADFAESAFPILAKHGFASTVFLPAKKIGASESWRGANEPARPLMSWDQVRALAKSGVTFGGHALTHPDLCTLDITAMQREVRESQRLIEGEIGSPVRTFAPPYGSSNAAVRAEIAQWYDVSVGVRLDRCDRTCDVFDAPRIEMHYYRNAAPWRDFLEGRGAAYLAMRKALRAVRRAAMAH